MKNEEITAKQMEKAYEIFQGNFFDGSWLEDQELDEALIEAIVGWAEENKSKLGLGSSNISDTHGDGISIEHHIKDELNDSGLMASFINSLSPELKKQAIEGIYADVESMDEEGSEKLLAELKNIIESIPAVSKAKKSSDSNSSEEANYNSDLSIIGNGKSAGTGTPGEIPANYSPDKKNPLSAYRNVAGCKKDEMMDYIYFIDSWDWRSYDYSKWPSADMSFPDLDEKKYDLWPYKPDLSQPHWMNLNDIKSGASRKGYTLGYNVTPEQYVGKDSQRVAVELESLVKEGDEAKIKAAGFKNIEHVKCVIDSAYKGITEAYAEAQKFIDKADAKMKEEMNANIDAVKKGGLLDPIKGISMDDWAAANAKIAGAMPLNDVLKVLGVEKPVWDEVSAEWMSRMTQDTTFAITKVYGDAFTNSNIGKFATEGGATAAASNDAVEKVKNDFDLYVKIMCQQNMGAAQGIDASSILKQHGLNAADWGVIGGHWGMKIGANLDLSMKMLALMEKYNAEFATAKVGDDISF